MPDIHSSCLICDSNSIKELKGYEKDYLVKCMSCGFVFCHTIPTSQELIKHYDGYVRNNYSSPITIKRYNELLDGFEAYRQNNNILDIGSGDGYFLETAIKRGWNVYGTEYTDTAIEVCTSKGISMQQGAFDASNYKNTFFDVITSFEVIEHINNPKEEINAIKSVLRKNGMLYITTPNFNSISRLLLKGKWNVIGYPEHLSYYTPKTIDRLLHSNGFSKIKRETTGFNITRFKGSANKSLTTIGVQRSEESLREKTETKPFFKLLKILINGMLNLLKRGDSMKVWYEKN